MTEILDLVAFAEDLLDRCADASGSSREDLLISLAGLGEIVRENHSGARRGE